MKIVRIFFEDIVYAKMYRLVFWRFGAGGAGGEDVKESVMALDMK